MPTKLYFKKLGAFAQVGFNLTDSDKQGAPVPIFVSAADITIAINELDNTFAININAGGSYITSNFTAANVVFFDVATPSTGYTAATTANDIRANWALLFPKEGGGSTTTPNLQQVTDVGASTSNSINIEDVGSDTQIFLDAAAAVIVARNGTDSASIQPTGIAFQDAANITTVNINRGTRAPGVIDVFEFPDKAGVPDTIATLSDITGSVGDLQQVTNNGFETTNILRSSAGAGKKADLNPDGFIVAEEGNNKAHYHPNNIEYIKISTGEKKTIKCGNLATGSDDEYTLPNKSGVPDIFAMITDVPFAGPYAAAITNPVNCAAVRVFTQYQRFPLLVGSESTNVYFSFTVTSVAAGLCTFEVQIPQAIPALTALLLAGQGAAKTAANNIVPVFIANIGTNKALIQYTAAGAAEVRTLNGIFSYTYT